VVWTTDSTVAEAALQPASGSTLGHRRHAMNAWGEDDPPLGTVPRRRGLRGRHFVLIGVLVTSAGSVATAAGAVVLGPVLLVMGVMLAVFGACGWIMERLGAWDDEPGRDPQAIGLNDVARLATRIRRR
jgi:hypothetical protein